MAEREDFVLLEPFLDLHERYCSGGDRARERWNPYGPVYENRRRHVLLCCALEDEREAFHCFLEQLGHRVTPVGDGDAALAAFQTNRPSVVLLDLSLPGCDPCALARRLLATPGPRPLFVALSGYGQPADRERARDAGFDLYLLKPVDPDHLERLIAVPPLAR